MTRVRTLSPLNPQIRVITRPTAIPQRYPVRHLSQILSALHLGVNVTILKHCPLRRCSIERFAGIKSETTMAVNTSTTQGIISTLKIAVLKQHTPCPDKRAQIKTRNETAIPHPVVITITNNELSLHDSISAFLPVQRMRCL
jgi:hypothetical protein